MNIDQLTEAEVSLMCSAIDWGTLCVNNQLSENFIRTFADHLNWWIVSRTQNLSQEFMSEFIDKIDWREVLSRSDVDISDELKMEIQIKGYVK